MKKLEYGLIANRHNMPVNDFIFNKIKDPTKIRNIEAEASRLCPFGNRKIKTIANDYKEEKYIKLDLYVTGLSAALISVIKACKKVHREDFINIKLVLKHYSWKNKNYHNQTIFFYK